LPNRLGKPGVSQERTSPLPWGTELRNNAVPIGDQHGLSAGREANILAEFVLEDFQSHCSHSGMVASGSYFVNSMVTDHRSSFAQPTQFDLVVNLRTTKALALIISQSILFRGDEVIQ
jgi:hypothetical protein